MDPFSLRKTKTKMIIGPLYTYRENGGIHITSGNAPFLWYSFQLCLPVCLSVCHKPHIPFVHYNAVKSSCFIRSFVTLVNGELNAPRLVSSSA